MLIALIDDGIDTSFMQGIKVRRDLSIFGDGSISEVCNNDGTPTIHGTTCAGIITKYAPGAEFCVLRVFHDETLRASCGQLAAALEWCMREKVPIVHMSIGTSMLNDYWRIRPIVAKMLKQRQVVVAAHSNKALYSMPACLSGVFGVVTDGILKGNEYRVSNGMIYPGFAASSLHRLTTSTGNELITPLSNSYAAPVITAAVHNALSDCLPSNMAVPEILRVLTKKDETLRCIKPDFVDNALVINPGRDLILWEHLFFACAGEFADVNEVPQTDLANRDIVYLPPMKSPGQDANFRFLVENSDKFEYLLYSGSLPNGKEQGLKGKLTWSENDCSDLWTQNSEQAEESETPIINIYGSGLMAVGLLCCLRNAFVANDYQCLCISDYPQSYLYGIEYIPPAAAQDSAIGRMSLVFSPDVIICFFQGGYPNRGNTAEIFYVILDGDNDKGCSVTDTSDNCCRMPADFHEGQVVSLYEKMLCYYQ